jgi:hypothetical protein
MADIEKNAWLDQCSVELYPPHPQTVPFKKTLREIKGITDSETPATLQEEEDGKEIAVASDNTISFVNDTEVTMDYRVVMVNGIQATTGLTVYEKAIEKDASLDYTPTKAGYYGIMSRENGTEDAFAMDEGYEIRFIMPISSESPFRGYIPGFTIAEFPDYYKLRLSLTDDMNSDYEFQKYLFELLFSYVAGDDNGTLDVGVIEDEDEGGGSYAFQSVPNITNVRTRNTSSSVRTTIEYPQKVMCIEDTITYAETANEKSKDDIIQFQHKLMFLGDTVFVPKLAEQATPGKFLIFAIRRRTLGLGFETMTEMSTVWGVPVELSNETIDITALETKVGSWSAPGSKSIAEVLEDTGTGLIDKTTITHTSITQPGVRAKLEKVSSSDDDMAEILENKHLLEPLINDTDAASASYTLTLTPEDGVTGSITITVRKPGTDGNSYEMKDEIDFYYTGTVIELATMGLGRPLTGQDFLDWYNEGAENGAEALQEDMVVSYTGDMSLKLPMISMDIEFLGGVDGHTLQASAAEIDAVVGQYHKDKLDATAAPGASNDATEDYSVGSRWYDTVAKEWYICTDATTDNATWDIMTLSTADLGSAALATIVNDLTTGGATDALSAEAGKGLATRVTTAEGEIDTLQNETESILSETLPVYAAVKLTLAAEPDELDKVTIKGTQYRFRKDVLSETGVKATAVLTSTNTEVTDGDTVTIGTGANERIYRFKDTPAQAYDVKRDGTTADTTLGNLVKAVNASGVGDGSDYYTGTLAHPSVTAGEVAANAITFTALSYGVDGNAIAKSLSAAQLDWDGVGATFTGGIDAAVDFDVYTGGTTALAATNLFKAITDGGTAGVEYWGIDGPQADITAFNPDDGIVIIQATTAGVAGNLFSVAESLTNVGSVFQGNAAMLSGGMEGTGTINEVDTSSDYVAVNSDQIIIVTTSSGDDSDKLYIPPATGRQRKLVISNQTANSVILTNYGSDTINGTGDLTLTTYSSVVLLDYAEGKWALL